MTATLASPDVGNDGTETNSVSGPPWRAWAHLLAVLAARMYRAYLLGLVAIALAPVLFGWGSYVIKSGSMEPSMQVGDVVVAKPYTREQPIGVGRVFVFDDPAATKPHLIVHRIVELRDDGDYTTAGDANEVTDITPLPRTDVVATAVILAPYVGLPVTWSQSGEWLNLILWLLFTMAAFGLATRNLNGEPPKWGLLHLLRDLFRRDRPSDPDDTPTATSGNATTPAQVPASKSRGRIIRRSPLIVAACLALLGTLTATANAGFTGNTRNSGNTWTTGPWTQPYVGAVLTDAPVSFWLLDETGPTIAAQDRSGHNTLGTYKSTTTRGEAGGLPNNPGTSISTTGTLALTSANPRPSSTTETSEFWFKSADSSGGYLTGFGSSNTTGTSPVEDRVVWMNSAGQITYGDWGQQRIITTPGAYNDNTWHHVVVVSTPSGGGRQNTVIYVDGSARVSGQTSKVDNYNGYVRVGGGTGSDAFNGSIDNVSIYGTALSAARVAAHWNVR